MMNINIKHIIFTICMMIITAAIVFLWANNRIVDFIPAPHIEIEPIKLESDRKNKDTEPIVSPYTTDNINNEKKNNTKEEYATNTRKENVPPPTFPHMISGGAIPIAPGQPFGPLIPTPGISNLDKYNPPFIDQRPDFSKSSKAISDRLSLQKLNIPRNLPTGNNL